MTTYVNITFLIFWLIITLGSTFLVMGRMYLPGAVRVGLTTVSVACWWGLGFWLLPGTIIASWGLTSTNLFYTVVQWLPFFIGLVAASVSIDVWGKVRQTNPFGKGGMFENFDYKPENKRSGYDTYKEELYRRTRK